MTRLNELLESSTYFNKNSFNYHNAQMVNKNLDKEGYFKAGHSLLLLGGEAPREVSSEEELTGLISEEKQRIAEDSELARALGQVEKALNKNDAGRKFHKFISDRPELLAEFKDRGRFKEKLWISYFMENKNLYDQALKLHNSSQGRRREILDKAAEEKTQWESVIALFNERFDVPFKLVAKNREQVMLAQESVLTIEFEFKDSDDSMQMKRDDLLQILSMGEKKALYILNILFEVEARKKSSQLSLFIIDDIADSFDYKNKHATIQYLREMVEVDSFRLIILTHNFDFLRTIFSGGVVSHNECFMAEKNDEGIRLSVMQGGFITNPFKSDFKKKMFTDALERIACIPFTRSILEYCRHSTDEDYLILTSLLHLKKNSRNITQKQLDRVFKSAFSGCEASDWQNSDEKVIESIWCEAEKCLEASEGVNFANKFVLAIALRLRAESYMLKLINDHAQTDQIKKNQTRELLKLVEEGSKANNDELEILRSVALIIPETLHINSFMYEPIIDMSDQSLRRLYGLVSVLDDGLSETSLME